MIVFVCLLSRWRSADGSAEGTGGQAGGADSAGGGTDDPRDGRAPQQAQGRRLLPGGIHHRRSPHSGHCRLPGPGH